MNPPFPLNSHPPNNETMAINTGALLLITFFLASASLSLAYSSRYQTDPAEQLERCLDRCYQVQGGQRLLQECEGRCAHQYYRERQRSSSQQQDEPWINPSTTSDECERQCQFAPRRQQGQCLRRCEAEQEQFPQSQWERCQRKCAEQGPLRQVPCQVRCAAEFGMGGRTNRWTPSRQFEECEERCEREPTRGMRQQCQRRCEREQEEFPSRGGGGKSESRWDRYERCQRGCADLGIMQQVPCQTRCAAEFGFRD